jgi:16S rRNA (cytidine1402-2'-O)-methyltransferase
MPGTLILCATPIGNLGDVTPRLAEALARADVVACEDTRRTGKLLAHLGIAKAMVVYADHNEAAAAEKLARELAAGKTVALVADAGTPLLADPGYILVRKALALGAALDVIPGPSAVHAALALAGLPPYPYAFLGYLPRRRGERDTWLARWAALPMTLVCYLTPHRVAAELAAIKDAWGDRDAALGRELTKVFQEVTRGPLSRIITEYAERDVKGELTLVVAAAPPADAADELARARELARALVAEGLSASRAAAAAARAFAVAKNAVYKSLTS